MTGLAWHGVPRGPCRLKPTPEEIDLEMCQVGRHGGSQSSQGESNLTRDTRPRQLPTWRVRSAIVGLTRHTRIRVRHPSGRCFPDRKYSRRRTHPQQSMYVIFESENRGRRHHSRYWDCHWNIERAQCDLPSLKLSNHCSRSGRKCYSQLLVCAFTFVSIGLGP
jgi:hypothetical protein